MIGAQGGDGWNVGDHVAGGLAVSVLMHLMVVAEVALDGAGKVVRQEGVFVQHVRMGEGELGQIVGAGDWRRQMGGRR